MIYKVTAKFNEGRANEFYKKLTDGTVKKQEPDGKEIAESMQRAVVDSSGLVVWSELCYCSSPLAHERSTILDNYFSELNTEPIDDYQHYEGHSFMNYLAERSKRN